MRHVVLGPFPEGGLGAFRVAADNLERLVAMLNGQHTVSVDEVDLGAVGVVA